MKKIRMIDVATKANVSKSTVSQYLNGRFEYMSESTRDTIKSAIKELNYIPNHIARSLKTNKTKTIGVIVRDITGYFTSRVIRGIDDYCKENNYNVLIYNTDFDSEIERRSLLLLNEMHVDGIIIMSSGKNGVLINQEQESGFPIVQVQIEYDDVKTSIVLSDYKTGSFEATEYLIDLGHRRICFMTQEYETSRSRYERFQGYKDALEKYKIPFDKELIQFWDRENSFDTNPDKVLKMINPPTVFFTQHSAITIDLLKILDKLGKVIPQEISVLGFDEIPMVDLLKVPITVVAQSPYKMGTESARLVLDKITGNHNKIIKTVLPCSLIKRKSCLNIK